MEVKIRPLEPKDALTSVKWRNDPEVFKYTGSVYTHTITLENEIEWVNRVIGNVDEYRCAIIADGKYVGNIYLTGIHDEEAEYHIFIGDKSFWGKGVAKMASQLIINHGFENLHLTRINLSVRPQNTAAHRLYQNLGFRETSRDTDFIHMTLTQTID